MSSTLALTAGALASCFPITLLPLAVRLAGWPRRLRGWLAAAAACALAAACAWPYRSAAAQFPETFAYYRRIWQNYNPSLYGVLLWLTGRPAIAAGIGEGVVLGLALWVACAKDRAGARGVSGDRRDSAVRAERVFLVFHLDRAAAVLFSHPGVAAADYAAISFLQRADRLPDHGEFRISPLFQWLTYAPFYALLVWELIGKDGAERAL